MWIKHKWIFCGYIKYGITITERIVSLTSYTVKLHELNSRHFVYLHYFTTISYTLHWLVWLDFQDRNLFPDFEITTNTGWWIKLRSNTTSANIAKWFQNPLLWLGLWFHWLGFYFLISWITFPSSLRFWKLRRRRRRKNSSGKWWPNFTSYHRTRFSVRIKLASTFIRNNNNFWTLSHIMCLKSYLYILHTKVLRGEWTIGMFVCFRTKSNFCFYFFLIAALWKTWDVILQIKKK